MRLSQLTARLIASFATDAVVAKITIDDCIRAISITREKRDWKGLSVRLTHWWYPHARRGRFRISAKP